MDNLINSEEIIKEIEVAEEELESAYILFENEKYRDCISRAYYSMFHGARALLLMKEIIPKKHSGVISMFGLHFVKEGDIEEFYGKILIKAFELRVKSDYNVMYSPTKDEAEETLNYAEMFLKKVKEILSGILWEKKH